MIFSRQIHISCGIIPAEGVGTQKALMLAEITTICLLPSYTGWYMTGAQHTAGTLAPWVMTSFCSGSSLNVSWALKDGPIQCHTRVFNDAFYCKRSRRDQSMSYYRLHSLNKFLIFLSPGDLPDPGIEPAKN